MKKNTQVKTLSTVATIVIATALMVVATATPAFADEPMVIQGLVLDIQQMEQPVAEPITDGGDWEMCPQPAEEADEPEGPFPDGGADEVVGPEEFPEPEEPIIDGGADEVVVPQPEEQAPQQETTVETETVEPETPATDDEPTLPFTGGNATPYAIGGLLMALAGVGVLIARRRSFAR